MLRFDRRHDLQFYGLGIQAPGASLDRSSVWSAVDAIELQLGLDVLEPHDVVLVAGGGYGGVAGCLALALGVDRVFVYEANPVLYELVKTQVKIDGQRLQIVHAAIGDFTGAERFHVSPSWRASSIIGPDDVPDGQVINVRAFALGDELRRWQCSAFHLDIEGAEYRALRTVTWRSIRAAVVEFHSVPDGYDPTLIFRENGLEIADSVRDGGRQVVAAARP